MSINITQEMPKCGQFVAIWRYNGLTWSSTHEWRNGLLLKFNEGADDEDESYSLSPHDAEFYCTVNAYFIVMGE